MDLFLFFAISAFVWVSVGLLLRFYSLLSPSDWCICVCLWLSVPVYVYVVVSVSVLVKRKRLYESPRALTRLTVYRPRRVLKILKNGEILEWSQDLRGRSRWSRNVSGAQESSPLQVSGAVTRLTVTAPLLIRRAAQFRIVFGWSFRFYEKPVNSFSFWLKDRLSTPRS